MYIPEFWCGFILGLLVGVVLIIGLAKVMSNMGGTDDGK